LKIYFDGDSWSWGGELENREQERFSALVCKKLNAEEHNFASAGASNDRIVRQLLVENDITDYDVAVIQMTYPSRTEYYNQKWRKVTIQDTLLWRPWKEKKSREHQDFWTYYYDKIDCKYHARTREIITYQTIKNHCKVNNVPLILMTNNNWDTDLEFDIEIEHTKYPRAPQNHPNAEGHQILAEDILSLLTTDK